MVPDQPEYDLPFTTIEHFRDAINYLLTLPFSHSHLEVTISFLEKRLRRMEVDDIKPLASLFPKLSALTYNPEEGKWFQ